MKKLNGIVSTTTALVVLAGLAAGSGQLQAAPAYTFTVIGEGTSTELTYANFNQMPAGGEAMLNNAGQVIGVDRAGRGYISDGLTRTLFTAPTGSTASASFARVAGLNESGQVAGTFTVDGKRTAFLFDGSRTVGIGAQAPGNLNVLESYAYGLNDLGQVVGGMTRDLPGVPNGLGFNERAFLFSGNTLTQLTQLTPDRSAYQLQGSFATRINNNGQVIGGSRSPVADNHIAVRWTGGTVTDLVDAVPFASNRASVANAINDQGWVVGKATTNPISRAFVATNTQTFRQLQFPWDVAPSEEVNAWAVDVNNRGQVIGTTYTNLIPGPSTNYFRRAFVWENGVMRDLAEAASNPKFQNTTAFDINERGEIVGNGMLNPFGDAASSDPTTGAFIWRNGLLQDLADLVALPTGARLLSADSINDNGQIAGRYFDANGQLFIYRLDPLNVVSEPGSLALVALSLLAVAAARRRG